MKPLAKDTLSRIAEQFPTLPWPADAVDELVAPRLGVISGFQDLLRSQQALLAVDLADIAPAGALHPDPGTARSG